jgi:putative tryptophan/tyrosine transport system substrate-binding protein
MKSRREFITLIGGVAAWPLVARAQQSKIPVIGLLNSRAPDDSPHILAAFRLGMKDGGFVEGQNVTIEYRFAENRNERLPALTNDLVHRQVTVIAAAGTPAALAAKAATTTIPIVFHTGEDPVQLGLVASLNRPGGNVTGVTQLNQEVAPKRLQALHELVPAATVLALLVNPTNPTVAETTTSHLHAAARTLGLELHVLRAGSEHDFDGAFAKLNQLRAGGLVPVQQSTKVEMFLNLKTANALGITVPLPLLGRADDVIE